MAHGLPYNCCQCIVSSDLTYPTCRTPADKPHMYDLASCIVLACPVSADAKFFQEVQKTLFILFQNK